MSADGPFTSGPAFDEAAAALDALFRSETISAALIGRDARIRRASSGLSDALGVAKSALIGRPVDEALGLSEPLPVGQSGAVSFRLARAGVSAATGVVRSEPLDDSRRGLAGAVCWLDADRPEHETMPGGRVDLGVPPEDLVSIVAHDLRGPLRSSAALADLMAADAETGGETERLATLIADTLRRLEAAAGSIFEFAALQGRGVAFEPVALADAVADAVAAREDAFAAGGVQVRPPVGGGVVSGDRGLLGAAFGALLDNALRHRGEDAPTIEVLIEAAPETWRVRVLDDGPGVASALADRVFEPFARGRPQSRAKGSGPGLGLSLCRAIAQAHGGGVSYRPREPRGSEFRVLLPRLAEPSGAPREDERAVRHYVQKRDAGG